MKFNFVYIIVVYRNYNDLIDLLGSIKSNSSDFKAVIINNYYDDYTQEKVRNIALEYDCDFVECENRGYSYSNNIGINFAFDKYDFDFLIVSNPDIIVKDLKPEYLSPNVITAGEILNLSGRKQNPTYFKELRLSSKFIYKSFTKNKKIYFYIGIFINKINKIYERTLLKISRKKKKIVFSPHGSFIIFPRNIIKKLSPIFDDNMFLFGEEGELAQNAKLHNIKIEYNKNIHILHKEDGSMKFIDQVDHHLKESFIYYYNKWIK